MGIDQAALMCTYKAVLMGTDEVVTPIVPPTLHQWGWQIPRRQDAISSRKGNLAPGICRTPI